MKKQLIATAVTATLVLGVASANALPQDVSYWQGSFDDVRNGPVYFKFFQRWCNAADSWPLYGLAYAIDGNNQMLIASGEVQYLDRALEYIENALSTAEVSANFPESQFKDEYLGWINKSKEEDNESVFLKEIPLYESYFFRYVCHTLRLIRQTPVFYGEQLYKDKYDFILAFVEKNVWEKWYLRGLKPNIYRDKTHMASHWAYIASELAEITEDPDIKLQCETVRDNISHKGIESDKKCHQGASLRSQLQVHPQDPSGYFWNSWFGNIEKPDPDATISGDVPRACEERMKPGHGQDVSHGNNVISYLVEANRLGLEEWTRDDMVKFASTMGNFLWQDDSYAYYLDGSFAYKEDGTVMEGNWYTDGWAKLGAYNADLQERLEDHAYGRNVQFYGLGAVNARILSTKGFTGKDVYNAKEPAPVSRVAPVFDGYDNIELDASVIDDMQGDVFLSFTGTLEDTGKSQSLIFHRNGSEGNDGNRFGLWIYRESDNKSVAAFDRTTATKVNQLRSENILAYMDGEEHTITLDYTGQTGLTEIKIDGESILSDAYMPNFEEAALGSGSLRIGSFGDWTGYNKKYPKEGPPYRGYPYIGTVTNVVINDFEFELEEGEPSVSGSSVSTSDVMKGHATGNHWLMMRL